ncbi:hypothetical protein PG999_003791 [Apiospora kogelbergensis]|uniref:Nephrocystin 3-like N-terminal domain-containing protein n=1 Tax=Apiospora kogelbergensis TaxID=1337665 RepID=A0AAW0R4G7_9PEZI
MNSFRLWLRNPNDHAPVYWINGPRCSGKSTFMGSIQNLLDRNPDLESPGIEETKFIIAKLIHPPTGNGCQQRSQAELYRSILHELRTAGHWGSHIPPAVATTTTTRPETGPKATWSLKQLKTAVDCLFTQDITSFRTCLLIDGLDEYAGEAVNGLMRQIIDAQWTNVKCCISTRPSPAFSVAFEGQPSLQMTDLTGSAMRKFALDQLASHEAFREMRGPDSRVLSQCIREIADAASGVFSWTQLAIAIAMREHRKGDGMRELRARIRSLPRCLEDLEECNKTTAKDTDRGHDGQAVLLTAFPSHSYDDCPVKRRLG